MNNSKIIEAYYKAWINKDLNTLKNIYSKDCVFNDPGFKNLDYNNTIKMWSMWFSKSTSKALDAEYAIIKEDNDTVTATSIIRYKFGKNQNPVTNVISATFIIKDNKIIKQTETFNFKLWFNQAFDIKRNKPKFVYKIIQKIMQRKTKKMLKDI